MWKVALVAVVLAGCASPEPEPWRKAGATRADFDQDDGYCTAQAFQNTTNLMQAAIIKNGCMRGRGWQ